MIDELKIQFWFGQVAFPEEVLEALGSFEAAGEVESGPEEAVF